MTFIPSLPGTIDVDDPKLKPTFYGKNMGQLDMPMRRIDEIFRLAINVCIFVAGVYTVIKIEAKSIAERILVGSVMAFICVINVGMFIFMAVP
jgi:hypothetical protein